MSFFPFAMPENRTTTEVRLTRKLSRSFPPKAKSGVLLAARAGEVLSNGLE
ncbi:MAG: hypothetical protein HYV63_27140 [Candidatus Schekmanbacteria bacterium]|nr:hypothetical protein [Candidatus Schekmanbacteria bacterium]